MCSSLREYDATATTVARAAVLLLLRSKLKYRATIVTVAEVPASQSGSSVEVAGMIENHIALGKHAICTIAEIVQHVFIPTPAAPCYLEDNAFGQGSAVGRLAINIARTIEGDCTPGYLPSVLAPKL